jgi:hypothetical protein
MNRFVTNVRFASGTRVSRHVRTNHHSRVPMRSGAGGVVRRLGSRGSERAGNSARYRTLRRGLPIA